MKTRFCTKTIVVGLIFAALGNFKCCLAAEDIFSDATNKLSQLIATKELVLSSRQNIIIQDQRTRASKDSLNFAHIDILSTNITQEFAFKAQLSQAMHTPTIMQVAANKEHASIVVETTNGQPYCLMTDHFLAICDPGRSGGLAYYVGGTVFWGAFQDADRTNLNFQMSFMATNVPPAAILDIRFILLHALAQATNASVGPNGETIDVFTEKGLVRVGLSRTNFDDSFGINQLHLQGKGPVFDFSDFQIEQTASERMLQLSSRNLENLDAPIRALNTSDLFHLNLLIPDGFPNSKAEAKAAKILLGLIVPQKAN